MLGAQQLTSRLATHTALRMPREVVYDNSSHFNISTPEEGVRLISHTLCFNELILIIFSHLVERYRILNTVGISLGDCGLLNSLLLQVWSPSL